MIRFRDSLLQFALPMAYDTWFVGKYGATPGKMARGLKVVVEDGSRVSCLRVLAGTLLLIRDSSAIVSSLPMLRYVPPRLPIADENPASRAHQRDADQYGHFEMFDFSHKCI